MSLPNTHFGAEFINGLLDSPKKVFFAGIGGISMCSLAHITKLRGHTVVGYDRTPSKLTRDLEDEGITVWYEGDAHHVEDADVFVYTVAIPPDCPEYVRAGELGIPRISRADFLGYLMSAYKNRIGVSGTHGKSTTTSMLERIFTEAKAEPTVSCGAVMLDAGSAHTIGGEEFFIYESCEYMDSFLDFYPTTALILNIEMDHVDYFKSIEQLETSFGRFAARCGRDGYAVVNGDDPRVMRAVADFAGTTVTFSVKDSCADFFAADVTYENGRGRYTVMQSGVPAARVSLAAPGEHLVVDSLAAFAASVTNGVPADVAAEALSAFTGVARRMEKCGESPSGAAVYTDYAHHPTEVAVALKTALTMGYDRVICAFQPHTYSRTKEFFDDFASVLAASGCDEIVLTDVYSARETDSLGIGSDMLADRVKALGAKATYVPDLGDLADYLSAKTGRGDMVVLVGAGDIVSCVKLMIG